MLSIVIPCYNEEKIISEIRDEYNDLSQGEKSEIQEILFVNDGSIDNTESKIIEKFKDCNIRIVVINLLNNIGKDRAIIEGVQYAEGDYISFIDADLQFSFKECLRLYKKIAKDSVDCVIGVRENYNNISNKLYHFVFSKILKIEKNGNVGDFFVGKTSLIKNIFEKYKNSLFSIKGVIQDISPKKIYEKVVINTKNVRKSKFGVRKTFEVFNSTFLLKFPNMMRISMIFALLFFIFSVGYSTLVIYKYFTTSVIEGYPSIVLIILFAFSMQFFILGVIGEYLHSIVLNLIIRKPYKIIRSIEEL